MVQINPNTVGKKRSGPEGMIFTIKKHKTCQKAGIPCTPLPSGVAGHKVIVLSRPDNENKVAIATITSTIVEGIKYFPIVPTPRGSYQFQLHIAHYNNGYIGPPAALPLRSYLRVERHEVPFDMLEEVEGAFGQLMLKIESTKKLMRVMRGLDG